MSEAFQRIIKHSDGHELRIMIDAPVRADENGDWRCDYTIDGLDGSKIRTAIGIDPIQALTLALTYISTSLYFSDEYAKGKLSWEGGMSRSDLGLPVAEIARPDVQQLRDKVDALPDES